jgi:hypothetical protein
LPAPQCVATDPAHLVFVSNEPPGTAYHPDFLSQFSVVLTTDPALPHPGRMLIQTGLPWWVGLRFELQEGRHRFFGSDLDLDALARVPPAENKLKRVSVICSSRQSLPGHARRIEFVRLLKSAMGEAVELYGHGVRPVTDKWDAIAPFRYHLAIENTVARHYWTEKLADAYLGWSLPIYAGCPNIEEYFPADSCIRIDLADPAGAVRTIEQTLQTDPWHSRLGALRRARERVLYEHNFFALLSRICTTPAVRRVKTTLWPSRHFARSRLMRRVERTRRLLAVGG